MDSNNGTIKICALCGASFTCSPVDCWCNSLPAIMQLDSNGDCYCPVCLKSLIDKKLTDMADHALNE